MNCFKKEQLKLYLIGKARALDIALRVNVFVKHPRSGLPPTVLYNLSYLCLQLQCTDD